MIQAGWVEIPVNDIQRALKFYQAVFALDDYEIIDDGTRKTVTLVSEPVGISLNQTANFEPGNKGVLWAKAVIHIDTQFGLRQVTDVTA